MTFKNSCKLQLANFSIIWKVLLYLAICCAIIIGLVAPYFSLLSTSFQISSNLIHETFGSGAIFSDWTTFFSGIHVFFETVWQGVVFLFTQNIFAGVYLSAILCILAPFMVSLSKIAIGENVYGYMSSLSKFSFFGAYLKRFGKSAAYAILKTLLSIPINLLIIVGVYGIFMATGVALYFIPLFLLMFLTTMLAFKQTLISGWVPAMVVFNIGALKGFVKGVSSVRKRYLQTLSNISMFFLIAIVLNIAFGAYSFIITLPFFFCIITLFDMVNFFHCQGMRYYIDMDTIISPKKLEENDTILRTKYIL